MRNSHDDVGVLEGRLKYASMDDSAGDGGEYNGWGWTTGIRMNW